MDKLTRPHWAAFVWGSVTATLIGVAVLGFGAPGWILVPASWAMATIYMLTKSHVERRTGRGGY